MLLHIIQFVKYPEESSALQKTDKAKNHKAVNLQKL